LTPCRLILPRESAFAPREYPLAGVMNRIAGPLA
jgi:hypothetical protein